MKCLEKDRNRRYETASALAADILHHLADEPVTAGPPSRLYRASKFVRRNRVPVVAALLVAAAILGGVAASAWQAVRATRAERAARNERYVEAVASAELARAVGRRRTASQGTRGGPAQAGRRDFELSDQRLRCAIPGARHPGRRRSAQALDARAAGCLLRRSWRQCGAAGNHRTSVRRSASIRRRRTNVSQVPQRGRRPGTDRSGSPRIGHVFAPARQVG